MNSANFLDRAPNSGQRGRIIQKDHGFLEPRIGWTIFGQIRRLHVTIRNSMGARRLS
jgi:hypothetical protein